MTPHSLERWVTLTGLVASVAVGVPVALAQLQGDTGLVAGPAWMWWLCFAAYLTAFAAGDRAGRRQDRKRARIHLGVQAVAGIAAVGLGAGAGWTAVLLVVTAVTAAYVLPTGPTVAIAIAQVAWVGATSLLHGLGATHAVMAAMVYGSLQGFGVVMVLGAQREAEARARLGEAHAEVQAASALLDEVSRSDERLRIARDLHDLIGHQLTALALELEVASHQVHLPAREHVDRSRRIVRDLLGDVRAAVGQLRRDSPPLRAALDTLVADLPAPTIHLEVADDLEADGEIATALLRCAQEIVTNTVRHARAENLWLAVGRDPDGAISLRATDDGRGAAQLRPGNGLTGMRERLGRIGGTLDVEHHDGFVVHARVPPP